LREAFRRINEGIVHALRSLGVPAELAGPGRRARPPDAEACFREPEAGEITVQGRKIVGSAQVRIEESFLQHGSVLLAGDQELLARMGPPGVRGRPAITIQDVTGRVPSQGKLVEGLVSGLAEALSGVWESGTTTPAVEKRARALVERYGSPEWTWRR
jgi:lipoate-protein ligase A